MEYLFNLNHLNNNTNNPVVLSYRAKVCFHYELQIISKSTPTVSLR